MKIAQGVLGVLLSVVLFALLVEVTDTNDYKLLTTDPATGLALYTPDTTFNTAGDCYENVVAVNNLGVHGPPVSVQKKPGVFRIVVIGSSYAAALQVPTAQMYSSFLQQKLNANPDKKYIYEVVPFALNQNSTLLDLLYYHYYASKLQPDLVIDIESQYELVENLQAPTLDAQGNVILQTPKSGESPLKAAIREFSRKSKLLVNLYNRALTLQSALQDFRADPFSSLTPTPAPPSVADLAAAEEARWNIKDKLLDTLASEVAATPAKLLLATWVGTWTATSTADELQTHMQEIATAEGISYVNLTPLFFAEARGEGKSGVLSCDIHWDEDGNRYIADNFYQYFTLHPQLLTH